MGTVQEQVHSRLPRRPDHRLRGIFLCGGGEHVVGKVSYEPSLADVGRRMNVHEFYSLAMSRALVGEFSEFSYTNGLNSKLFIVTTLGKTN